MPSGPKASEPIEWLGNCWHQSLISTCSGPAELPLAWNRDRRPLTTHPSVVAPGGVGPESEKPAGRDSTPTTLLPPRPPALPERGCAKWSPTKPVIAVVTKKIATRVAMNFLCPLDGSRRSIIRPRASALCTSPTPPKNRSQKGPPIFHFMVTTLTKKRGHTATKSNLRWPCADLHPPRASAREPETSAFCHQFVEPRSFLQVARALELDR